jgi:hypothetical protein
VTPRATRQLTPNFHELGWQNFQKLSNELFSHEPDTASDEYGTPGQRQHGIDLLATIKSSGIGVGQCKCEGSFSEKKIRDASDEFFRHWAHWKDKGVRRFILFVACDVTRTELQNEMLNQRARFAQHGIDYELWGGSKIQGKLRPHRIVARTYIDSEEIVNAICGPVVESAGLSSGLAVVTQRLGIFATELEELRGKELESLRELCRTGEQSKALAGLLETKGASTWGDHTPAFRARVLRFEAAVRLNLSRDTTAAAALVDEAHRVDPSGDFQTIDAYLAYCRRDSAAALSLVVAPKSAEARNLRWSLLLETGALDQLGNEAASPGFPPDAESHRILALLALARADTASAHVAVAKAIELAPARRNVRLAKAAVDYFSALSPAAEGMKRLAWAVPISWIFVKRDATAVAALHAAESEFVASAEHPDCLPAERETLQVWRLACVACMDQRQGEAAALVQTILAENPANFGAIAWALHRGYPIDTAAAVAALRQRLLREPDQIDVWLALWSLTWFGSDPKHGEAIVDEGEGAFRRSGNSDLWLFHKAQFVARTNRAAAVEMVKKIGDPETKAGAEMAISRASAEATKNLKEFAAALEAEFIASGNARRLFECCELKLRLRDHGFIAQHAKALVESIGTASALRLALEGAFKHGDHALCLSLLHSYRHFFRDGSLSPDVRHLKAICHHQLGDWPEAAKQAGQTYHEQTNLTTFLAYFDLLLRSGDTRGCSVLARDLLTLPGAKPAEWLRAAAVVRLHDANLAKELWRRANRRPIKNLNLAGLSLEVAFSLGLPNEAEPLLKRLRRLAQQGRGPLREKSYEDIVSLIRAERETEAKNLRLYEEGAVPIHLFFEQHNRPLVLAFHAQLEAIRGQTNLLHAPVLFARSGARRIESRQTLTNLVIDVSSLILAADLGILDQVESSFAPIFISQHATVSLFEQVARVHPSQPERHAARQKFLELVRNGRIAVVDFVTEITVVTADLRRQLGDEPTTLLELAAKEKGVVLHDGAFLAQGGSATPVVLPPALADYVMPLRVVRTDSHSSIAESSRIPEGAAVLVPHSVFGSLAPADIEAASARFRVMITRDGARDLEQEVAAFENARNLAGWTQALLDRVQRGIAGGTYRVLRSSQAQKKLYEESKPATRALLDLLAPTGLPDGVTWCDDRVVNQHLRAGDRVVVGVSEILVALRMKGALSKNEFFDVLLRLRQSNVRYLPLAEGEIEHHLTQAEVKHGRLVESAELAVVRRYLNACMLDRSRLQAPKVDPQGNLHIREFEFMLTLRRAADEALRAIWKSTTTSVETRSAQADWILENIYLDLLGMRQAQADRMSAGEVRDLTAASVGMLYTEGIGFDYRAEEGKLGVRQAFFGWLTTRLLSPLTGIEPTIASLVGKVIGNYVTSALNDSPLKRTPDYQKAERILWMRFVYDLPPELQHELDLPSAAQAQLGLTVHGPSVRVRDRVYPYDDYWKAMAEAVNGRKASVRERGETHELTIQFLQREADGRVVVEFVSDDATECGRNAEPAIPVLHDAIEERIKFMESRKYWFDCAAAKRADAIQRIAAIQAPAERFDALNQWRANSPEFAYRHLGAVTSQPGNFSVSDLYLSDWTRLPEHLRLPAAGTAKEGFRLAAEALHQEEGLSVALRRMMCFPRKLPETLEATWRGLPEDEVVQIFGELKSRPHSVVADLHLLRLAALRPIADVLKQAEEIAAHWLDPVQGANRFDCYRAVLRLIDGQFTRWAAGRQLPSWLRLACVWYQSSRVHGFLRPTDEDLPRLTEWLEHNTDVWTEEILARETAFWSDLGRAGRVTFGSLILHGMAHLLGEVASAASGLGLPTKLKTLLEHDPREAFSLRIELARRSDLSSNMLGSFLGGATVADGSAVFGQGFAELFALPTNEDLGGQLEDFAKAPNEPLHWAIMHSVIGEGEMPETLRARFIEILRTADFTALARVDPHMLGPALTFSTRQARASGDEALMRQLEETIMKLARLASEQASDETAVLPLWQALPNALLPLAVVPGDEDASARRFFDLFRRFAELCPALATRISAASMQWVKRLPFAQQVNLWPLIFTLRALR